MAAAINWGPALLMIFGFVVTAVYQTHHFDKRIDDLKAYVDAQVKRLEDRILGVEARISRLEDRVGRIEERLEHPIYRP